ncbi:MAG: ParB/RepB/Spo0J family partition protein [Pseudomonadota bacterium]|nr:ParB/RepB/Spo0J family partition protein [Pseudomonadota bacterium]
MATKKPKGLGLGLEALLGPTVSTTSATGTAGGDGEPHTLFLDQLQAGRYQPRSRMDEGALFELAESIRAQGIMQPVLVRPLAAGQSGSKCFEIIAGERRFRAARLAGLDRVPVLVRDVSDAAAAAMSLIENIQREDLNPLEEARGLKRLTEEFGMTHEAAASAVGRSRSAASNLLRLLNLSASVQQLLLAGDIEMGHARALLPLDGAEQIISANEIVARKLSVREAEKLVARRANDADRQSPLLRAKRQKARDILRLEQQLSDALTAKVEVRIKDAGRGAGSRGEIVISFASLDELNGLLIKLGHDAS